MAVATDREDSSKRGVLRRRIMASVGAMVFLSLCSSTFSLYRITEVNQWLEAINHVAVPMGRLFAQMQSDAEVLHRELQRTLGGAHWKDPNWQPKPAPRWIEEVLVQEMARVRHLILVPGKRSDWIGSENRKHWLTWSDQMSDELNKLIAGADDLFYALRNKDEAAATSIYPQWIAGVEQWKRQLQWGAGEYERAMRQSFAVTENRVAELRTGLEMILVVVALMSLLILWLGERALRPLAELTQLAREITRRGLRKEDKSLLPDLPITRSDEVSQLAREFHHMATALLEREKTVEAQKSRLQEQNRLLREIMDLQERLRQAEHLAAIGRLSAQVAHEVRNPLHSIGLEAEMAIEMASKLGDTPLRVALQSILSSVDRLQKLTENYLKLTGLSDGQKSSIDLKQVLNSVLHTYEPLVESQNIRVTVVACEEPVLVWADADLIEQVLGNLFKNSIQALEAVEHEQQSGAVGFVPKIRWSLGQTESGSVWMRIEDNGPGVSPMIQEKLFTPFVTTRAQGTGLGLSFIKKVLEDHGGTIVSIVHQSQPSQENVRWAQVSPHSEHQGLGGGETPLIGESKSQESLVSVRDSLDSKDLSKNHCDGDKSEDYFGACFDITLPLTLPSSKSITTVQQNTDSPTVMIEEYSCHS